MYAGDYIPAKTQAELAADQRNKVYYNAADTKLSWSCPTTGSLTYHKTDGTTKSFTGFTRYYCEAYISQATSSRNIQGGERFTATGGELNIGEYQRSQYCSKKTTEPWIQVGQWLKSNTSALPSGNLWIRVSACNASNQLNNVIFWINAGAVSKLVPVKDLYISASGNDFSGDGTREKPYATLGKAYTAAAANGDRIVLLSDLTISSAVTFSANKSVTITSDGTTAHTLSRENSFKDVPLNVTAGSVTLENIVVDGKNVTGCKELAAVKNDKAVLTLGQGAVLRNNNASDGVGGVYVNGSGKLVMDGGAIQNCRTSGARTVSGSTTTSASALLVDQGKWEMKGDSRITGNTGTNTGSGGAVDTWGTVTIVRTNAVDCVMSGGVIENNTGSTTGGIFLSYISSAGSMTLTGGTIQKNTGTAFGGINVYQNTCVLQLGASDTPIMIKDNKKTDGTTNNLNMSAQQLQVKAAPAQGSAIGISATLNQTFAVADSADIAQSAVHAFFSDQGLTAQVTVSGSNLQLTEIKRLYVSANGNDTSGDGTEAKPYKTLDKALSQVSDHCRIILLSDATYSSDYNSSDKKTKGKTITICSESKDDIHTITINETSTNHQNSQFHLPDGESDNLTLENVTLQSASDNDEGVFGVFFVGNQCTLTLNEGATLTNMDARAINIRSGGKVVMNGGKITGNTAGANSAYNDVGGSYTGTANAGAAVYVCPGGTFEMNGGEISGNYSAAGGAVYAEQGGTVKLKGKVTIDGNYTAEGSGVGADVYIGRRNNVDGTVKVTGSLSGSRIGVNAKGLDDGAEIVAVAEGDNYTVTQADANCFFSNKKTAAGIRLGRTDETSYAGKVVLAADAADAVSGAMKIDIHSEALTDLKLASGIYSYKLGNAAVTGVDGKTFEIGVDTGYFTVDTADLPDGCTFYASLTTGGVLATSGTPRVGANYTYLQFKCGENVSGAVLQRYLREHVTFHRPAGAEQKVTVLAENVTLPSGTEAFMGHYYQFVADGRSIWTSAYAQAKDKTFNGLQGYLLTITNKNEHNYIYQKFGKNGWMSATRSVPANGYDQGTFTRGSTLSWVWKWACGPEADTVIGAQYANSKGMRASSYANWHSGEPNGKYVPGTAAANEGFGQYGYGSYGRWNDLPDQVISGIQGYYVEFGGYAGETLTTPRAMDVRTIADPAPGAAGTVSGGAVANGKTSLTVSPADANYKYAVVDEDGKVVNTTQAAPWTEGDGGALTFAPLDAGKTYHIVSVPKQSDTAAGQGVVGNDGKLTGWPNLSGTAKVEDTVVAPVDPGTGHEPLRGGGTVAVPQATDTGKDYALADSKGNLVTDWTQGKTGGLTFEGLDPDETYTLVEAGHADTGKTPDPIRIYDTDKGVKILPVPGVEDLNGAYDAGTGKSSITIDPAQAGLTYTATPVGGEPITGVAATDENGVTTVTFPGLTPSGEYQIAVSDGINTTQGPKVKAPVASAASPVRTPAGAEGSETDTVTLPGATTDTGKLYALVDVNGNFIKPDGSLSLDDSGNPVPVWFPGTGAEGNDLTWKNLDPDAAYQVLTADKAADGKPAANSVPARTPVPSRVGSLVKAEIDPATGKGVITIGPADPGSKYTVDGTEYTVPEGGVIAVPGLIPGRTVTVTGPEGGSAAVTVPAVSADQVRGKVEPNGTETADDDASVTIDPSVSGVEYAVVDMDGNLAANSKPGNGGPLTFDGLKPDTEYKVVALPGPKNKGDGAGEDAMKSAVPVVTTFADPVDPNQVAREEGTGAGTDKITISDTKPGLEYAVIDRETGRVVAPAPGLGGADADGDGWVSGNGGGLSFDGLDPNKTYDVVTRVPAGEGKPAGAPSQPVSVMPITPNTGKTIISGELDGSGKRYAAVYPSDPNTKYAVVDKATGRVVAPINGGSGDGWVTGNGTKLELGPLPEGDYAVVSMPKSADDTEAPGKDTEKDGRYPGMVVPAPGSGEVNIPALSADQLSGSITGTGSDAKASITIQPADRDMVYGVVDENGDPIPGVSDSWFSPGPDGSVTISGLPAGTQVQVVAKPKSDPAPAKPSDVKNTAEGADNSALGVPVMTADAEKVQPDQLTREPDSASGTDRLTVAGTKPGYVYSLVDANTGKPAGEPKPGTGGSLTFDGLDPDASYEVKVSKAPAAGGVLAAAQAGPVAAPTAGLEDIRAGSYVEGSPATACVVITEPKAGVAYGVKGSDGRIVWADAQGEIRGLTPDAEYTIVSKPAGTADSAAVKGGSIRTPSAPTAVDRGADGSDPAKDQLTFTVESGKRYAVVDSDGIFYEVDGSILPEGSAWKSGTGSAVTVRGLDPSKTYKVLVKDSGVPNAVPSAAESRPDRSTTVPADSVAAAVDSQGTASILVNPSLSGKNYVVVDKNNKVVATGVGNGGTLTFSGGTFPGILPGQKYTVAMVDAPACVNDTVVPGRGAGVDIPAAGANGITTGVDPAASGKRTITVEPTNPGVDYILVTPDGAQVGSAKPGSADHGPVTFTGLDANTQYHVVTVPHGTAYAPTVPNQPAVRTPSAGIMVPTAADVTKTQTSVTINPALEGQSYNLLDSNGNLVGQWVPGSGKSITFNGLSPNSTYTVVVMQPDADSTAPGKQPSGIVTGPTATTAPGSGGSGGSGGSSGSGTAVPPVKVDSRDGTVTLSPSVPEAGNRVTITVRPNRGKAVAEVVVTDKRGNRLTVIDNKDGTYSYLQPEKALAPVTVTVRYKSVTGDPSSNGVSDLLITDRHIVYMQGDNMGLFRPTANMTRAEAVQVFYNLLRDKNVSGGPEFRDVPADAWYAPAVRALSGMGIVKGVGDGAFAPNQTITRAEFVAIASRFADRTAGSATFPDVPADHWAYASIGQAVYYGWVRGNDDGTFRPGNPISRAEAVRIVNVMLGRSGDRSYIDANAAVLRRFPDVTPGYWAYYEIAEAANAHEFAESNGVEIWNP